MEVGLAEFVCEGVGQAFQAYHHFRIGLLWLRKGRRATAEEIAAYVASGEPMDKAGAYGIQGLGGVFVEHLQGSFTGVMGLPVYETAQLLKSLGLEAPPFA